MQVWYLSVASIALQAVTSLALLQRELRRKLGAPQAAPQGAGALPAAGSGSDGAA
jgi:hypothetical protein